MFRRKLLHKRLIELFGSENVYFQPPGNLNMEYPAIVYSREDIDGKFADDAAYLLRVRYQIVVIDKRPDNEVINKLLRLSLCSYNRHYISDNLHHDVFTLYF